MESSAFQLYERQLNSFSKMNLDLFAQSYMDKAMAMNLFSPLTAEKEKPKYYTVEEDGTAVVSISGILRNQRSFWDMFLGGKTSLVYDEIIQAAKDMDEDESVKRISFYFDTPGGEVLGMDNAAVAVNLISKPTTAYVRNMCASGGIYLASQCDKIVAMSEGSVIGSIGVMQRMYIDPDMVSITSSNAPKKSPDPMTKKGKEIIVSELDEMEDLFLRRVAEGRKTTVEYVKEKFGQGGTMLAKRALDVGLIDSIQTQKVKINYVPPTIDPSERQEPGAKSAQLAETKVIQQTSITKQEYSPNQGQKKEKRMDIQTLQKEHPEVFAQAVKVGEENERKRVSAFNAYKVADPENLKLVALCEQAVAEGKQLDEVLPSLQVAIRDFSKGNVAANPASISTQSVDPVAEAARLAEEKKEQTASATLPSVEETIAAFKKAGAYGL